MTNVLMRFKDHGKMASFHYADDSCKEWGLGDKQKAAALKLFDDNPELQNDMRLIARGFIWSLESARPEITEADEQLPVRPYDDARPLANGNRKDTLTGEEVPEAEYMSDYPDDLPRGDF